MNQQLFPSLFQRSFAQDSPFWQMITDFDNNKSLEECLYWVETEFVATKDNVELLIQRAGAFMNDLTMLKVNDPEHAEIFNFLQFYIATGVLKTLSVRKIFPYCFDWIANALDGQASTEKIRDMDFERLHRFGESAHPFIREYFSESFCGWVHDLFYYSRSTGGHKEAAQNFVEGYLDLFGAIVTRQQFKDGVMALTQIASWCHQMGNIDVERKVCGFLYRIYSRTGNEELKKIIAFHFCVADANYTTTSKREWCQIVQNEHYDKLGQHEPVQLLVNLHHHDVNALVQHFDGIIEAVRVYRRQSSGPVTQPLLSNYNVVRLFSILERATITLLMAGHVGLVNRLIGSYSEISDNEFIDNSNCFIISNHPDGVFYCSEKQVVLVQGNTMENIPAITKLTNRFFGVNHTFNNLLSFLPAINDRDGVPNPTVSEDVVAAIRSHFSFQRMLEIPGMEACSGYYLQYGTQMPIQNIMAIDLGFTLPLIHSFRKPLPARRIEKVYIWEGETILAEYERIGLQEIFESFGITVVYDAHHGSSKEEFLTKYADLSFDLVWIICHGQYFHHESHKSHLVLGPEMNVFIHEIPALSNESAERRLLFIDACDGATTSLSNSPQSIGIGPAMIGNQQSLLSHGWPVDNHASLVMGLIMAIFLCSGHTYAQVHYNAIVAFRKGKDEVLSIISKYVKDEEILDRIWNKEMDYDNFMFWGSPLYME